MDYEEYYRATDDTLSEWRTWGARFKAENILRLVDIRADTTLVELGCGEGAVSRALTEAANPARVLGLDISYSAIQTARRSSAHPALSFETYDGRRSRFEDDAFHLAVSSHVLEHVMEPRAYLTELGRLAPLAVVEVPMEDNLRLVDPAKNALVGHINYYRLTTLVALLESCGLRLLAQPLVTWPLLHRYQPGIRRLVADWTKLAALRLAPPLARGLFTYHATVLVGRSGEWP